MRRALLVVVMTWVVLGAAACRDRDPPVELVAVPDAAPVGEVTLPTPQLRAGDVIELDAETSVSAKVRLYRGGKFGGFLTLSVSHKRHTRAEVQQGGRVRLTYLRDRMTDVATGAEQVLPVEGKTYLFDASGVTADGGGAISEAEDTIVRRDAGSVVTASALPGLLAGRKLTLGAQEDLPAASLPQMSTGSARFTRFSWLYKGQRARHAMLGWTGAVEDNWINGMALSANLVGEVTIEPATGKVLEATSDGPVTVEVPVRERGKNGEYMGNGRMQVRVTRR